MGALSSYVLQKCEFGNLANLGQNLGTLRGFVWRGGGGGLVKTVCQNNVQLQDNLQSLY